MAKSIDKSSIKATSQSFYGKRVSHSIYFEPTNDEDVVNIKKDLNPNKALGYDDIPTKLIKAAAHSLSPFLSSIFNSCLESGHYPDGLKIARITPLHKGGFKSETKIYRPVSILSVFNKLFETISKRRLLNFWNKYNVFVPTQFGFREKHSTTLTIAYLNELIINHLDNNNSVCPIFLDLAKAFDTCNHKILLFKLDQYEIRGVANDAIRSDFTNREQFVSGNGYSSSLLDINIGVPQGSVLGPILFLIYINDVSSGSNFKTTLYADYSVLTLSHKIVNCLQTMLNFELPKINAWLKSKQLSLNLNKTNFLFFTKRKEKIFPQTNDGKIKQVNCVKYLGVFLDDKLTWKNTLNTLKLNYRLLLVSSTNYANIHLKKL